MKNEFHPQLRHVARLLPRFSFSSRKLRLIRALTRLRGVPKPGNIADIEVRDEYVRAADGASLRVRLYRPKNAAPAIPAMLWVHGGGFIMGAPEQDERTLVELVRESNIAVAAVGYRLAPEHCFPTPLDDCYAALSWLHDDAASHGIDARRIAIGGASAGGGLAAALTLMARDRGQIPVAFQLLIYPMLDDRTALLPDGEAWKRRLWTAGSNVFGWTSYLGHGPGGQEVSAYAAPARCAQLAGLPPTWIGVGTFDLFYREDIAYAERLERAKVPCKLHVIEGAYHAFDYFSPRQEVVQAFRASYLEALNHALLSARSQSALV